MKQPGGDTERERILAAIERERSAVEKGDSAAYLSILSDDAVFMPPNYFGGSRTGREESLGRSGTLVRKAPSSAVGSREVPLCPESRAAEGYVALIVALWRCT